MILKCRSVFLGVALVTLLLSTLAATAPPIAAATRSAAASSCDTTPVFFGLHGMREGPNAPGGTTYKLSPEIQGLDYEQNLISGAVLDDLVPYTTVDPSLWDLIPPTATHVAEDVAKLLLAVNDGENALQNALMSYIKGCTLGQVKIALVGYSMGAWVINMWLNDNPGEWILIKAVVLYGDPCWIHGADKGLVRAAGVAGVADIVGCSSAKAYPYPAPRGIYTKVPFLTQSWCVGGDPVCGGGYAGNLAPMVPVAVACVPSNSSCPHNWYQLHKPAEVTLKYGAQFVVKQLLG
jgi:hypothetical protein